MRLLPASLRGRLMVLVVLAVLPALGLVVYSSRIQQELEHRAAQENALRLARLAASTQDRLMEGARQLLTAFVQFPEIRIGSAAACSGFLAHLLQQFPRYANFGVADARGQIFCSSLPIDRPVDASQRAWFQLSLAARGFAAGDYQIGTITHKATINFADAVLGDTGRVERVVFVALDLSWVTQFGAQIDLPQGTTLTVLDRNGTILARYPDPEKWIGATVPEAAGPGASLIQTFGLRKGEGFVEAPGVDRIDRIYAIVPLGGTSGQVRAGIPTAVAYASVHRGLVSDVTALLLAAGLALAAVWFGGAVFILQGVNRLVGVTRRLASGDLGSRASQVTGPAEIAQLAAAFDRMADALAEREAQRREAQRVLQDSEQRFRLMFAGNPLPMWVYDLKTLQFLEVNDAAIAHYGYSREEFLRMRITDIRPEEDVQRLVDQIAQGRPPLQFSGEWRHRRKNGDVIDVQIASHAFVLAGRDVVLVVAYDITERKKAEQRFAFLADASKLLGASLDYRATLANVARVAVPHIADWCAVDMVDEDQSLQRLAVAHVDPAKVEMAYELQRRYPTDPHQPGPINDALRSGKAVLAPEIPPAVLERAAGNPEQMQIIKTLGLKSYIIAPIVIGTRVVGLATFVTAESDRRFAPEDLAMAEEFARRAAMAIENAMHYQEAQVLNLELERRVADRTAQLETANKELESFSYSVAHDLRAPLRAMDGFSRMVVEDFASRLPEEGQRYLHLIRDNAQQMGHLIDDLLTLSRLGRQALSTQPVKTVALVRQVIQDLEPEYEGRTAQIAVGDLPDCHADPALLKQVFANLLSNALKFTRERDEPRIEVSSHMDGGQPVYCVKDNGVGFDMQYADKLFGVFQRLHRAEEYAGTGVGLAIVQRIVHRHGGRVWAESAVDKGAAFHFTLGGAAP